MRGDLIQKVEVAEPDGTITRWDDKNLDPERLPYQLRQWADRLAKKDVPQPWKVTLTVDRDKDVGEGGQQFESKTLELAWDDSWRFDHMLPMNLSSPQAIAELGLAYQIKTIVADVLPGFGPRTVSRRAMPSGRSASFSRKPMGANRRLSN